MRVLKTHKAPNDDAVYRFILKKEAEGKSKRQAKIVLSGRLNDASSSTLFGADSQMVA
jgi:hypothetical protein